MAVLVRDAGPVAQNIVARKLKVHFPFSGWTGEPYPVRLVHHRDDATWTSNRFLSGNRFRSGSLERVGNVVLEYVVRGKFRGKVVEYVLRQPRWQILRHVATVVGVGTGLATLDRYAPGGISAGHIGRKIQIHELSLERRSVRGVR